MLKRTSAIAILLLAIFLWPHVTFATWTKQAIDIASVEDSSIAVDSDNKVHISYFDNSNEALKYATNASGSWVTYVVDSGRSYYYDYSARIAVDSNNKVHISYYGDGFKYATNASGSWAISSVDTGGWCNSIGVDSNNAVHISYFDDTNMDLKYATNESGSWAITVVDSDGDVGRRCSLGLDSNNMAHILLQ
jgi:hypothetical protein